MRSTEVRRLRPDEWRELRELRLEALGDAPGAFATPYVEAAARPAERWKADAERGAAETTATFVAERAGSLVGMVSGWETESGVAELIQMFVRPEARGAGVGATLVEVVADWARSRAHAELHLGVAGDNSRAERLYVRCGFVRTGETAARTEGAIAREVRMALAL